MQNWIGELATMDSDFFFPLLQAGVEFNYIVRLLFNLGLLRLNI